jgi:hypothetical protein
LLAIARRKRGTAIDCPRCHNAQTVPDSDRVERPKPSTSARLFESNEFDRWLGRSSQNAPKENTPNAPVLSFSDVHEAIVLEEEVELREPEPVVAPIQTPVVERRVPQGPPTTAERQRRHLVLIAGICVIVAFFIGVLVGRFLLSPKPAPAAVTKSPVRISVPASEEPPAAAGPALRSGPLLTGTLSFRENGGTLADSGTAVIVIPAGIELGAKIATEGLRPEDQARQSRPGLDQLRRYGGQLEYADATGNFRIELVQPGKYWVLALSGHRRRGQGEGVFPADRSVLNQYFADPVTLLEDRDYLLISRQVPEGPAQPVLHSF